MYGYINVYQKVYSAASLELVKKFKQKREKKLNDISCSYTSIIKLEKMIDFSKN